MFFIIKTGREFKYKTHGKSKHWFHFHGSTLFLSAAQKNV